MLPQRSRKELKRISDRSIYGVASDYPVNLVSGLAEIGLRKPFTNVVDDFLPKLVLKDFCIGCTAKSA